jgi:hypothetical protein
MPSLLARAAREIAVGHATTGVVAAAGPVRAARADTSRRSAAAVAARPGNARVHVARTPFGGLPRAIVLARLRIGAAIETVGTLDLRRCATSACTHAAAAVALNRPAPLAPARLAEVGRGIVAGAVPGSPAALISAVLACATRSFGCRRGAATDQGASGITAKCSSAAASISLLPAERTAATAFVEWAAS